ncbi:MAG: peptidoglycan DD-metalloendopeptidase family protein [Cyanobacteriota bacterium]|nr:peptidoglycan DD-metalloendopeptidase family protein [Cyanobacteriota bacterium]
MKRAYPHKVKSAATSKLPQEVLSEISSQGQGNNNMACCPAAMIGLAALSTMGVPSILLSGGGDRAMAAEPPSIDLSHQEEASKTIAYLPELDVISGAKTPKGLLLEKLTREYVEEASDAENLNTLETVLLVGEKQENPSFNRIVLEEPKKPMARATLPDQQQYPLFKQVGADKPSHLKTEAKPQISGIELSEAIGPSKQLKTKTDLKAELQKPTVPDLVEGSLPSGTEESMAAEWRYDDRESSSNSLGTISGKLEQKTLAQQSYNGEERSIIEPSLPGIQEIETEQIADNTPSEESAGSYSQMTTQVEGAVVIDSQRIETPVAKVYEVRLGDTLAVIASSNGVSVSELIALNKISDPNLLLVSQTLKIPQKQSHLSAEERIDSVSAYATKVDSQPKDLSRNEGNDYGFTLPTALLPPITDGNSSKAPNVNVGELKTVEGFQLASMPRQGGDRWTRKADHNDKFRDIQLLVPNLDSANNASPVSPQMANAKSPESASVTLPEYVGPNSYQTIPVTSIDTLERKRGYNEDYSEVSHQNSDNNSYSQRLRAEIQRLRQQYEFEIESQPNTNNWDAQATGDRPVEQWEPSLNNSPAPTARDTISPEFNSNSSNQFRQPEINSPQNRRVFESMSPSPQEIYRPESLPKEQLRPAEGPSIIGSTSEKARQILNSSLGEMVSPDIPPLEGADTYLPGGSIQFTGYMWPAKGTLTSGYGWRWGRMHQGIDIAAPTGTPIMAAAPGVVSFAGWNSGYGYLVEITHPDNSLTLYAHNSLILVQEGQKVAQGELISKMGSTGRSTGPHLHFEIHPPGSGAANPIAYLPSTRASR